MQYRLCAVTLVATVITNPEVNQSWQYWVSLFISASVCFLVIYFGEERKKQSIPYLISCSAAAAWMAHFLYPSVKGFEMDIYFIKGHPFATEQLFVGMASYFGILIFKEIKSVMNFGWRKTISQFGDKLKEISKENDNT